MNIFMTGGTGFIGGHLSQLFLKQGDKVTIATRNPDRHAASAQAQARNQEQGQGQAKEQGQDQRKSDNALVAFVPLDSDLSLHMKECNVVVNLAGETLFGKRWTGSVKKRLYNSRIQTTRSLVDAMRRLDKKPDVFLSASAVGYYGDCGSEIITEKRGAGNDFLARMCHDWEHEALKAESLGIRVVIPRTGVTLGREGGALATLLPVFKAFIGGSVGSGTQYFPWIHIEDLCKSLVFAVRNEDFSGTFNATAPKPVTMNEFAKALGEVISRPSFFRVPEFALDLVLGNDAASMITNSHRAIPVKLHDNGFNFQYEDIGQALRQILRS